MVKENFGDSNSDNENDSNNEDDLSNSSNDNSPKNSKEQTEQDQAIMVINDNTQEPGADDVLVQGDLRNHVCRDQG